ncbi:MAG: hypothetical protein JWO52_262 [Gammaproteobacteria bacterium]|jgi:uncharacterized protein (PEP-CTERM system associated)|nr:hypothetical protein [Gammaproteobacteria bacterium]
MAINERMAAASGCRSFFLFVAASAAEPAWSDVQFVPSISASAIYVDNLRLVPPGTPKTGAWVGEVDPELHMKQKSSDLTSALDYKLQALWFNDHSDLNSRHHNGRANASWIVSPNLFFVDGWVSYVQQTVDPTQPINQGNLFGVGNVANRFTAYLAPTLQHDFGEVTGLLRYSEAASWYSGIPGANVGASTLYQNSRSGITTAKLAADDPLGLFFWSIDGRRSFTTFKTAQPFRDDRVAAEVSVPVLPSLRLVGATGAETNILTNPSSGGLNSGFWLLGFKWTAGAHSDLEVRAGHRFYGKAYSAKWTLESRLLTFAISYVEEPTTAAESDSLVAFTPGEIVVDTQAYFGVTRALNTYTPFLNKQFDASIALSGHRTVLTLRAYQLRRDYLQAPLLGTSDSTRGGEVTLTRQIGPRDSFGASARIAEATELSTFFYRDHRYALDYTHKLSATLDSKLEGVHLARDGTIEYRANVVQLTVRKTF